MKITLKVLIALILVALVAYFLGPKPKHPAYSTQLPVVPELNQLEQYVKTTDAKHKIKAGNEAEIVWADSANKKQTEYAVVYLHGFSASKEEGNPVHEHLAKGIKANLYLSRLEDHGIDTIAPMQYLTADRLWESAKQALEIGRKLGKKVILVGTSTGGTLALKLAATYPDIHSLILLSPNIAINDKLAFMLNAPWGLQIARSAMGGKEKKSSDTTALFAKYWYPHYRLEAAVQLQELVATSMNSATFSKVTQPALLLYYYKNEKEQDPTVRVDAELKMFDQLGTPENQKTKMAVPNAASHVIGSYITSKDVPAVEKAIDQFVKNTLKIPVQ